MLLSDKRPQGPGRLAARMAEALGTSDRAIENLQRRFVQVGVEAVQRR